MSEVRSSWSFVGLTPEARKAAEEAAEAAGMDLDTWLSQLIKYRSAIELRGGERSDDGDARAGAGDGTSEGEGAGDDAPDQPQPQAPQAQAAQPRSPTQAPTAARPPDRPVSSGAYVRPQTATRAEAPVRSLETRAAELRRREAPQAATRPDPATRPPPPRPADEAAAKPPAAALPRPSAPAAGEGRRAEARPRPALPYLGGAVADGDLRMIATDMLRPSLLAAINIVGEGEIEMAAERWRRTGRLEPLTVRAAPDAPGSFEIVAGIDRWHAARRAKAPEVPIIERVLNDEESIREGLAARLKRGHLSALDEADVYLHLMTDAAQTTEQVARLAGKPPAHIATMVRVLNLPKPVRQMVERGELTVLHARALLDTHDPEALAREIVTRHLDIYQTEQLVRMAARDAGLARGVAQLPPAMPAAPSAAPSAARPAPTGADGMPAEASTVGQTPVELLERHLSHLLGLKVTIAEHGDDGVVSLHYASRDQLSDLIARLNSSSDA